MENLNYSKREFRKLLILSLQCFKYKGTGTRAMWNRIDTWLADEDDSEERTFKDWEELTSKLWDDNLLTRVMSGPSMGPKNLGNRPSFTSDVIKQFPVGFGQHRRHIISSSTLGKAIEKGYEYLKSEYTDNKNQVLITLNEWLTRNHETVKTTEYSALRAIWTHVHNHSGNIWVGDGKWNSAIGLIRGSLTSLLSRLNGYESVSTVVLVQEIEKIEPIYNGISIPWNELIQTLSDAVKMSNPVLSPISLNIAYTKWSEEIESIFNGDTDYNESQKVYEELDKAIPESNFISLSHVLEILDRLKNKPSKFFKKEYFPIYRKWIIESSIPNEKISKFKAREIIQEWILNCDLDYPQTLKPEHKDEYFDELCAVYSGLLNPTFHLFDENDILDRYLNLYYDKSIR